MSNNDNNQGPWGNSPWGSNGGNRGGSRKGNGGGRPPAGDDMPDIDELLRKSQQHFKKMLPGGGQHGAGGIVAVIALLLVGWLLTGFYRVDSREIGLELTFGEWTNQASPALPGLHYHFPYPVGQVEKVNVTKERRISIGTDGQQRRRNQPSRLNVALSEENIMLTGDQNIVEVSFGVFWKIKNAADFLFNVDDAEAALVRASESVMRDIIGQNTSDNVLVQQGDTVQVEFIKRLQDMMDAYRTGIAVDKVDNLVVRAPAQVIDAFNDVQRANSDAQSKIEQARAYANAVVPRAEGQSQKVLEEAKAYYEQETNKALGDAQRFTQVLAAFKESRDVTTQRLYLETMEDVLSRANKIVIDSNAQSSGVLPFLPLPEMQKRRPAPAAAATN